MEIIAPKLLCAILFVAFVFIKVHIEPLLMQVVWIITISFHIDGLKRIQHSRRTRAR